MLAFSDIIDFLLHLLGDDGARAEFDRDPQGALERAGLDGVTAQDIRDARLQLADSGAVCATDDGPDPGYHRGADPVHEIGYTTRHYAAQEHVVHETAVHNDTFLTVDDRDTLFFQSISDNDVTVTDNSVAITDSFNQDNSDDDLVAIQDNDTIVSDDDTVVSDDDTTIGGDVALPPSAPTGPDPADATASAPLDAEPATAGAPDPADDTQHDGTEVDAADAGTPEPDPADPDPADAADTADTGGADALDDALDDAPALG